MRKMPKNELTFCYLTKRQNAIAGMANLLRSAFTKVTAFQASSIDECASLSMTDIIIADREFKNIAYPIPVLHVIPPGEISSYIKQGLDFITEEETATYALIRGVKEMLERKRLEDDLEEASIKDELTGLYNQKFLTEALAKEVKKAIRYNYPLAILCIGIDSLRKINEKYGHAAGDKVITDFGLIAANSVRCVDTIGRFTGDEFLAILPETTQGKAINVCKRIQNGAKNFAFANGEAGLNITVGIGVSELSSLIRTKEEFLETARKALACAKRGGTGSVCTWDEARQIDEPTKENKELITSIGRQATLLTEETKKNHYNSILKLFNDMPLYNRISHHSEHTAFYSERLASKIGLSSDDITVIRKAAMLHDIGKLAIDERIILKNGPLTGTEYAIIKQHPIFAAQMLAGSAFLKNEVNAILHHHEFFDGGGYPDHMKGTYIPMPARIIGLAESWDTMITPQPYREAMPLDQALGELKKGAGRQFDPELVAVFTGLIEN